MLKYRYLSFPPNYFLANNALMSSIVMITPSYISFLASGHTTYLFKSEITKTLRNLSFPYKKTFKIMFFSFLKFSSLKNCLFFIHYFERVPFDIRLKTNIATDLKKNDNFKLFLLKKILLSKRIDL